MVRVQQKPGLDHGLCPGLLGGGVLLATGRVMTKPKQIRKIKLKTRK